MGKSRRRRKKKGRAMTSVRPNRHRYLISLANELEAQANRVRDLIGDRHWLSDGHLKEYLLIELLRRHLPAGMIASRGFVVSPQDPDQCSTEQDILILDTLLEAPLLNQGGLCIALPQTVRAAISVKTTLKAKTIRESVEGLQSVRNVVRRAGDPRRLWCGAYYFGAEEAFEKEPAKLYAAIRRLNGRLSVTPALLPEDHPPPVGADIHCLAKALVYKATPAYKTDGEQVVEAQLRGYQCAEVATAVFLGEILDHVAWCRGGGPAEFTLLTEDEGVSPIAEPTPAS